jgi:putative transposase
MQKRFGRKISDLGFADFVNKLKYMAQRTGTSVVEIDRFFPSSQLC